MAFGSTPRDSANIPVGCVYVPTVGFKAVQGANNTTDGSGNDSAGMVVTRVAVTVLNLASSARATFTSGALTVGQYVELSFDMSVTALTGGASPTVNFKVSRIGADGVLYQIFLGTALSAAGVISTSIGSGLTTSQSFGSQIQVDMILTGSPTSITFSGSVIGK